MNWHQLVRFACAGTVMAAFCSILLIAANAVIHPATELGHALVIGSTYFVSSATNYTIQKRAVFRTCTSGNLKQLSLFVFCSATLSIIVGQIGSIFDSHLGALLDFYAESASNLQGISGLWLATLIAAPLSFLITRRLVA
jgi:hypothetical protein